MQINIDLPTLVIVLLVVAGSGWLAGYLSGRKERELAAPKTVPDRLRHRLEPDEPETTDTTAPEPADDGVLTGRQRFANLAAGSSIPSQRRHLDPDWHRQFEHMVELYGEVPKPELAAEATPFFDAVSAALVMPTAEWRALGQPGTWPDGPGSDDTTIPTVKPQRVLRKHKRAMAKAAGR